MPGRPKGGHGAWKKGHKQKQSVPPWAYPSPPLSHPPPFPGFPPYSDDSDIWDDTALIKAYDKAVTSFKTALKNGTATCESPKTYEETKSVNKRAKTRRRHKRSSVSPSDKESAPSADDYEMPGRPKGGHGERKKGHKQKQSVPPWAYPSPPLSHPPPFPGFPPYGTGRLGFTTTAAANNNHHHHHLQSRASPARFQSSWGASLRARSLAPSSMAVSRGDVVYQKGQSDDSDIWHDAALIKAYDKAVTSFKRSKMAPHLREPQDLRGDKVREQAGEDTETAQEEQRVALRQDAV
ncbi:uncharacterized protein LOC142931325 [Petromyzon marinus]|uniref:uncharacterized protein LOC142931325 n=1 Tax=Petromyzon marinus TaxID=7757 RepID=UPI003F71EDF0